MVSPICCIEALRNEQTGDVRRESQRPWCLQGIELSAKSAIGGSYDQTRLSHEPWLTYPEPPQNTAATVDRAKGSGQTQLTSSSQRLAELLTLLYAPYLGGADSTNVSYSGPRPSDQRLHELRWMSSGSQRSERASSQSRTRRSHCVATLKIVSWRKVASCGAELASKLFG